MDIVPDLAELISVLGRRLLDCLDALHEHAGQPDYIGGRWSMGNRTIENNNSSETDDVVDEYPQADAAQMEAARKQRMFSTWASSNPQQRFELAGDDQQSR